MNNRSLATMISTLTLLTLFTACSKVKELENRTKNMEQSTSEMKSITAFMYPQVRTKETEDTRSKKMAIVLSPNAGMGEKIAAAAVYYQSFEFHFWNDNDSYDTEHTREKLFLDAINEFYRRMKDIYEFSEIEKMSPTKKNPKKNNYEMAFYAMATSMHMINHHQEYIAKLMASKGKHFEVVSFYDLLKKAVYKETRGEELNEWESFVVAGKNYEITKALLNARFNMMAALAVDFMVNLDEVKEQDLKTKLSALMAKLTQGKHGHVRLHSLFEKANEATQNEIIKRLEAAMKTKKVMDENHINLEFDPLLALIYDELIIDNQRAKTQTQKMMYYFELIENIRKI